MSPLLANIYLNPLDHLLEDAGFAMVRYADDFVILCKTRKEAEAALALVQRWVAEEELTLHPTKTKIVDARTEGFDFLVPYKPTAYGRATLGAKPFRRAPEVEYALTPK
jgi:RNA-directed DNA polymerase